MSGRYPTAIAPPSSSPRRCPYSRFRRIVSPETRNSSISTCHGPIARRSSSTSSRVPRRPPAPAPEALFLDELADPRLRLWPHLEVVVDRGELPVEREPVARVRLHRVEE